MTYISCIPRNTWWNYKKRKNKLAPYISGVDHQYKAPATKLLERDTIELDDIKDRIRKKGAVYSDNIT